MPPQKEGNKETLSFRCPANAKSDFIRNVESRGWTKDEALRRLVESCNDLFEVTGGKPEWPLVVIDDDTIPIYMDPKAKAAAKEKLKACVSEAIKGKPAASFVAAAKTKSVPSKSPREA